MPDRPGEYDARRLYEAGQRRAAERAAKVRALRKVGRTDPLVLAVLERWGWDPPSVSDALADQAIEAVQAVINCLVSVEPYGSTDGGSDA